jgi:hypothetical protein
VRGKGSKLGEPCPKVRLSQDRLPILQTNVICTNVASCKCHSTNIFVTDYHLKVKTALKEMKRNIIQACLSQFIKYIELVL